MVITHLFTETAKRYPSKVSLQVERGSKWERYTYAEVDINVFSVLTNLGLTSEKPVKTAVGREVAVKYCHTAGVPPVAAAILIANGAWDAKTMVNVEELDPDPFIALLNKIGLPTEIEENPAPLPASQRVK